MFTNIILYLSSTLRVHSLLSFVFQKEKAYNSHADCDLSVDRPDQEQDRQRRRAEKEKDRKEERERRDRERDEKDIEHDSRDLDNVPRKRIKPSRMGDESVTEQMHQHGDGGENFGTYSISASSSDDKNALKSEFSMYLAIHINVCLFKHYVCTLLCISAYLS